YYWGVLCQLVFQRRLGDIVLFADLSLELETASALNARMQDFFRHWHALSHGRNPQGLLDQTDLAWFAAMNRDLGKHLDDVGIRARLRENVELLEDLAAVIVERAVADGGASLRGDMPTRHGMRQSPELFASV